MGINFLDTKVGLPISQNDNWVSGSRSRSPTLKHELIKASGLIDWM